MVTRAGRGKKRAGPRSLKRHESEVSGRGIRYEPGRIAKRQTPERAQAGKGLLAVPAPPQPTKATLLVETFLLSLGAEEASVPQLAQDARALHGGLEPLQKAFGVLPVSNLNDCQGFPPRFYNNAKRKTEMVPRRQPR